MNIEQELAAWDGISAADIASVYTAHHKQGCFSDVIVK